MILISEERKKKSEEICRRFAIPVNPHLPFVENEQEVNLRSLEETAWRTMCLGIVAMKADGMPYDQVLDAIERYGLRPHFSPLENNFISVEKAEDSTNIVFSWRYESYWTLLWTLGWIDELSVPAKSCDVEKAVMILLDCDSSKSFIEKSSLLNASDILDQLDLTYRYDWACVEARLKGLSDPQIMQRSIVYERHYALNWLVKYFGYEWDDVTCDT